jgi:SSS family solute:Na+ symporter
MEQTTIAILIIGASMFFPLWIGAKAAENDLNTVEEFFILSRNMSLLPVFFTVQATWWSAFAFLGATSFYYYNGPVYWTTIGWDLFFAILFFVIGKRIWFYGKNHGYITATDFFMDIYQSKFLATIVTVIMLLFTIPYFQIQITGGAYLIEVASKGLIPRQMGALIFTTVIVIYVWTGGLRAVAWADIFYGTMMIISAVVGGAYIVYHFNGTRNLFEQVSAIMPEALTLPGPTGTAGALLWLSMFIIVPIGAIMSPPLWIRMYSVRDAKYFYLIPFLLGLYSCLNIAPMLIGNAGIILEQNVILSDSLFPRIFMNHGPYFLAYIVLIGAAAAAMSTSNSQIHAISTTYTIDIHRRHINPRLSDIRLLRVGRYVTVIFAAFSFLAYLHIPGLIIQIGLAALSGTAQLIVPAVGALFWERSTAQGAIAGLLCGLITLSIFTFADNSALSLHAGLIALMINTTVFLAVSLTFNDPGMTKERIKTKKRHYDQSYN